MFNYAIKFRHLSPYAENPFSVLELDRMPVENAKPIVIFTPAQEREFLTACDDWQFPLFLLLTLTGLRPGELTHLLLPDDLDLDTGWLYVRNKPRLGWQVKTRNERDIPLVPPLVEVLRVVIGSRVSGPVFLRRRFSHGEVAPLNGSPTMMLERELAMRASPLETQETDSLSRCESLRIACTVWRDAGYVKTDRIRTEFMRLTRTIGLPEFTAPKLFRHLFATSLQDANVDPLIRCELMGHATQATRGSGHPLGMTATYTHSRPETKRSQLEVASMSGPAVAVAESWLKRSLHLKTHAPAGQ